jgi:uracil-DNA glycosylase family 4
VDEKLRVPQRDCDLCPRLKAFREDNRRALPRHFNAPVLSFGPLSAPLLIVGLAPGLNGANKTGRPFTGDWAGDLLYATLLKFGFATGRYEARVDDGLTLVGCRIANAVRCVPPQNKPIGPEVNACRPFLEDEIAAMPKLTTVLALGGLAHGAVLSTLGVRKALYKFAHNATHRPTENLRLVDSYHCSRYNTNTGRLTTVMFEDVFETIRAELT